MLDGVYNDINPVAIPLNGLGVCSVTYNADAFQDVVDHMADTSIHYPQQDIVIDANQIINIPPYLLDITNENLGELKDVELSVLANNDMLTWNGVNWVNSTAGNLGLTTDDVPEGIINLYYTDLRVGENPTVNNNTIHGTLTDNPHSVTQTQVGLPDVDNTSDLDKPISDDTQAALDLKTNDTQYRRTIRFMNSSTYDDTSVFITSDGINVTLQTTLSTSVGGPGNFDLVLDGEDFTYDASQTIILTPGSDTNPVNNWIYIIDVVE